MAYTTMVMWINRRGPMENRIISGKRVGIESRPVFLFQELSLKK